MSPPVSRPYPRFVANAPKEKAPYGRWGERLVAELAQACEPLAGEAGATLESESIRWYPERSWGGRVYVPATARAGGDQPGEGPVEYFGHVSFTRQDDSEPGELRAKVDFTDVTADDNPDWQIDLNDDVIGPWRSWGDHGGDVTLVWGLPLVARAVAATAELDGEVLDQAAVDQGRFTLVAVDAVHGWGDDLYLEVCLWDRQGRRIAAESLYAEAEQDADEGEPPAETG